MATSKLNLTEKQYRVLTWNDDVEGMTNIIEGSDLVIYYELDRAFWEQRISLEEVALTIHDIYDLQEEAA